MKFNKAASNPSATINYEGGLTFRPNPEVELALRAVSTLVGEPKFYARGKKLDMELISLVHQVSKTNPAFVLKLAAYCRTELHLRSIPMLLLAEYANTEHANVPRTRQYVTSCIERVDDMTELLAYQFSRYPRKTGKIPMMLKFGIADAFRKFDEYQFAKYNRDSEVKLRDVLFLCRPKPDTPSQQAIYDKIAENSLAVPDTWEVVVSRNDGRTKKEKWEEIYPKMGYMALLRNLRNMIGSGMNMADVSERIRDRRAVAKSKQMPFRFFSAYKEVKAMHATDPWQIGGVLSALEDALLYSVDNIQRLPGKTLIAVDVSGSMQSPFSRNSTIQYIDIATLYGSLASRICENAVVSEFADEFKIVNTPAHMSPLAQMGNFTYGGATYAYKIMEWLLSTGTSVDRIIIFSDFQVYNERYGYGHSESFPTLVDKYRQHINKDVYLYTVDLAGYGTTMLQKNQKVALIGGWSDRVFELIGYFEADGQTMVDIIRSYDPKVDTVRSVAYGKSR